MIEKTDPAHEIPEDVIEKAVREMHEDGLDRMGHWESSSESVEDVCRSLVLPTLRIAWAAAREQALAEAEEAILAPGHATPTPGSGLGHSKSDAFAKGVRQAHAAVAALRRKEGGHA
ncbi:hypothetical protein [Mycetocola saprophilus]|uniref:hypothetical protein n=1 Tax=Mycetocola saprophilus TaxID=76636 RepID=UPI0004BFC0F3|nr:hypothetical protein [Mycetocola saprophilus]